MTATPQSGSGVRPPGGNDAGSASVAAGGAFAPGPGAGGPLPRSTYLQYLPGIYQDNDFLGRFLLIFESILAPIDRTVGNIHHYLNPDLTPPETLRWLASWLGVVLDARWPVERQRDLVRGATDLYGWRGTRRGLSTVIRLATGATPEIIQHSAADVSRDRSLAYHFRLRLRLPPGQAISREFIETLIDMEKPAWAACDLELEEAPA